MPSGSANSNSNSSGDARSPHPLLFSPLELRGMQLKNRLVVPPMVHYRAAPGAQMGNWHLVHLGRYAIGGFGLVIVEATAVEQVGLITEYDLGLWNDDQAESFRPLTEFFKSEGSGCKIGIQLAHGGRKASSQKAPDGMGPLTKEQIAGGAKHWTPVGPTATPTAEGWLTPRELTTQECEEMVGKWANSARLAVKAGFDMIELHMAHGYLLASFLSPISNTRTDKYGGPLLSNRIRLPLEITSAVRSAIPIDMPLFVRVSCVDGTAEGWNMEDTVFLARELKRRGVDVVDCSSGGLAGSATALPVPRSLGFQVPYAERVKKRNRDRNNVPEEILQKEKADLVAVGRQAQYNPNLALHWAHELGMNEKFEGWPSEFGWWLDKRQVTIKEFATATGVVTKKEW